MILLLIAFFSGVLTVLAPCVLPLLPIILGSSVADTKSKKIPLIVISSLAVSVFIFSLLLKATTLLIDIPPSFWKIVSGGLVLVLGIITLFPYLWKHITTKFGFSDASQKFLHQSSEKQGNVKYVLLGAALGPVFSSCSPTYALILAIILPAGFIFGIAALISYILGLSFVLFLIALLGQRCIKNMKWISKPGGIFQRILGVIFILVGLAILTGYDKKIEAKILDLNILNTTNFEQSIINTLKLDVIETSDAASPEISFGNQETNTCTGSKCEKKGLTYTSGSIIGYEAPDLRGLAAWINSPEISSLQELRGKVVMIDFWTLGCINCINTHKNTQELYETYKDDGFIALGLHAPEFAYEQNIEELQKAVDRFGMTFPVAQDNDFATWKAYNNRYWPAFYIIDKQGIVRYTHFGEGAYKEKEKMIQQLLSE